LRICLSSSFTQYTVTITQVQESVSDFNPESESGNFKAWSRSWSRSPNYFKLWSQSPTKNEDFAALTRTPKFLTVIAPLHSWQNVVKRLRMTCCWRLWHIVSSSRSFCEVVPWWEWDVDAGVIMEWYWNMLGEWGRVSESSGDVTPHGGPLRCRCCSTVSAMEQPVGVLCCGTNKHTS